eukprot:gene5408-7495_t
MGDFLPVKKRGVGGHESFKYPEQHQKLTEMGFDIALVTNALEEANGDLEVATAVLLGERPSQPSTVKSETKQSTSSSNNTKPNDSSTKSSVAKPPASKTSSTQMTKTEIKETHNKFMASYKVSKCKEKANHDKRMCIYWHTKADKRRNPFEILYTCSECPYYTDANPCEAGDNCLKAHNMLERMFHPDLFKISKCQRGPNGSLCERGNLCAFAHSEEDHRVPASHGVKTAHHNVVNSGVSVASSVVSDTILPNKVMGDSKQLDGIQEKLINLIKSHGIDGIISSELPKRFYDVYNVRLDISDETGEKFRIKDLLLSHANISVIMHKGVQPKYVYDDSKPIASVPIRTEVNLSLPDISPNDNTTRARRRGPSGHIETSLEVPNPSSPIYGNPQSPTSEVSSPQTNLSQEFGPSTNDPIYLNNSDNVSSITAINSIGNSFSKTSNSTSGITFGTMDYSSVVTGATSNGRRRGPDTSLEASNPILNNNLGSVFLDYPDQNSMKAQLAALQKELQMKSLEYDSQTIKLNGLLQQLTLEQSKNNGNGGIFFQNNNLNTSTSGKDLEIKNLRSEVDVLRKKVHQKDEEVMTKLEDLHQRDCLITQLKQEKNVEMSQFTNCLIQIENLLVDIQRKEAIYINELSLHDTINESSRARDELTKYVNILKIQLSNKLLLSGSNSMTNANDNRLTQSHQNNNSEYLNVYNNNMEMENMIQMNGIMKPPNGLARKIDNSNSLYNNMNQKIINKKMPDIIICSLPGCGLEGSFICSACGEAGYCGADHQREHWASHISVCSGQM